MTARFTADTKPAPAGWGASARDLAYTYGQSTPFAAKSTVFDSLSFDITPGTITGILGRNGAGKSTIGKLIAGRLRASNGTLNVNGASPWEDSERMAGVAYIATGAERHLYEDSRLRETLKLWADTRDWNPDLGERLLAHWGLDPEKDVVSKLSQGQKSAFNAVLGLASNAPLTIFDEVHLGMDAVVRQEFYDELIAEYTRTGRTFILSSHLIDEVADLLEYVIYIHNGQIAESGAIDDVRERHRTNETLPTLTDIMIQLSKETS